MKYEGLPGCLTCSTVGLSPCSTPSHGALPQQKLGRAAACCAGSWFRPGPPTSVLLGLVPAYSDEHHHRPSRPLLRLDKGRLCWRPMGNDHLELRLDRWTSLYKSTPRRYFPPILCAFFPILLTLFSWRDRLCRIWGRLLPIWVVVSIRQRT